MGGSGPVRYVKWSAVPVGLEPPDVVTTTSTTPEPAGAVAVIPVLLLTVNAAGRAAEGHRRRTREVRAGDHDRRGLESRT